MCGRAELFVDAAQESWALQDECLVRGWMTTDSQECQAPHPDAATDGG
jgi:hypothetical protein